MNPTSSLKVVLKPGQGLEAAAAAAAARVSPAHRMGSHAAVAASVPFAHRMGSHAAVAACSAATGAGAGIAVPPDEQGAAGAADSFHKKRVAAGVAPDIVHWH